MKGERYVDERGFSSYYSTLPIIFILGNLGTIEKSPQCVDKVKNEIDGDL